MADPGLPEALHACANGVYILEAAVGLIVEHATWLSRDDFTRYIHVPPAAPS
jgi:hypothetical protein